MIVRICCCCPSELGAPIEDGKAETTYSHGFCQKHYDEQMASINAMFAEIPADLAHWEAA